MTMVLALHEQQYDQLSWTPDTVVNLHTDRRAADVSAL
jgi:hypothetical protein